MCQLPSQFRYGDTGWPTRQIPLGQEISHVTYFKERGLYVIATLDDREFKLPEDEHHKEWLNEGMLMNIKQDEL
jgi:cleavage and polyadenylation specificity factor subunit 1